LAAILSMVVLTAGPSFAGETTPVTPAPQQGARPAGLPAGTLATVNGVAIPQQQLEDLIHASGRPDTLAARRMFTRGLIARELIRQAAQSQTTGHEPQLAGLTGEVRVSAQVHLYIDTHLHPAPVTDALLHARYGEVTAQLGQQQYKTHAIVVASDAAAADVMARLRTGTPFETVARQSSLAPERDKGGDLPWLSFRTPPVDGQTAGVPLPVAQALSNMKAGEITPTPVVVGNTRVILMLDGTRPTVVPSFEEMKPSLQQSMEAAARGEALEHLVGGLARQAVIVQ
jgi:hypothetical protein